MPGGRPGPSPRRDGGRRPVSGSVEADLPAPLPDITIWSWQSRSTLKSNSGTYDYAFSPVLGGFDIPVTG
ncbi:MAG: hypothetical protein ACKOOG_13270, partial [Actinomycetota bacterium]